jgi:hypothetical protein
MDAELLLKGSGGRELGRGDVNAHRMGAELGHPPGEVAGATAELDNVLAFPVGEVAEGADGGLGDAEDAPVDVGGLPGSATGCDPLFAHRRPVVSIGHRVIGDWLHGQQDIRHDQGVVSG